MSVRAYKIIEIKHNDEPTFNCWSHDNILDLSGNPDFCTDDGGLLYFEQTSLKNELKIWQDRKADGITDFNGYDTDETIDILNRMIKDCGKDGCVEYYCF